MRARLYGVGVAAPRYHAIALEVEWTAEAAVERVPYHEPMVQLLSQ
jgi:hypothetical protein